MQSKPMILIFDGEFKCNTRPEDRINIQVTRHGETYLNIKMKDSELDNEIMLSKENSKIIYEQLHRVHGKNTRNEDEL